eukprot:1120501-Pyramimonas_sp.AAC.1
MPRAGPILQQDHGEKHATSTSFADDAKAAATTDSGDNIEDAIVQLPHLRKHPVRQAQGQGSMNEWRAVRRHGHGTERYQTYQATQTCSTRNDLAQELAARIVSLQEATHP